MKTKEEIVKNWLPRYTGEKLENFGLLKQLGQTDATVSLLEVLTQAPAEQAR